jgi:hypothetical protein
VGAAVYIVLSSTEPGFDAFVNGKALARAEKKLTKAAERLGVTPLMSFFSMSQDDGAAAAEEFDLPDDVAGSSAEEWFDPDDGLRTVRALMTHFDGEATALGPGVREELEEFATVLQRAKEHGLRWHLAADY